MKFPESWLREWVNPDADTTAIAEQLTMAGHEVEDIEQQGAGLETVVIGEVISADKHPDADRLSVCEVSAGGDENYTVVCGAPNVRAGMKSPLALPGVRLPNGLKLRRSKIRGVESNGMLCSAIELGLGDESDGIIELPADAPAGEPISDYLMLPDTVFDVNLTPNRGDCFSVLGIARDVAALTDSDLKKVDVTATKPTISDEHPVIRDVPEACPRFAGRIIRGIDSSARSPVWMTERLRRSGLREIHPVVDVTNYVMLELGQPLHAYDLDLLQGAIRPRFAAAGEKVTLLDEREVALNADTVVIADDSGSIGLAGIMGGLSTAVSDTSANIFFEAAFWPQDVIAGRARSYGLHTDASLRFERGVDPQGQARAVERATELLLEIAGGEAGPLTDQIDQTLLPSRPAVTLRKKRLAKILGTSVDDDTVGGILGRLGLQVTANDEGWSVVPPGFRFDLVIEEDLIEEVARIFGYDRIPETTESAELPLRPATETEIDLDAIARTLVARDYQEAITYSFVDSESDRLLTGVESELVLSNPISTEMSVMRGSLWSGLLTAAAGNVARQQDRVRMFEIGKSFHGTLNETEEVVRVAAVAVGNAHPEQWGVRAQGIDFFDIKSDLSSLLAMTGNPDSFGFEPCEHAALQPGQSAKVIRNGIDIGVIGKLHPRIAKSFGLNRDVLAFELDARSAFIARVPVSSEVSKFPAIRRDIAVVVDVQVPVSALVAEAASAAPELVTQVTVFDVYKGPGIEAGLKSVALGLILQETSRTLTDEDADAAKSAAVGRLQQEFAAVLRE